MAFAFPISILLLASGALLWGVYGLPGLLSLTAELTAFCQSVFVRCLESIALIKLAFLWTGALLLACGIIHSLVKNICSAYRANREIKKLPLRNGSSVILIKDKETKTAFTHGLLRPRIYISEGLINSLERDEFRAVFMHELHHKRRYDPLRFFILNMLKDAFFYIPIAKHVTGYIKASREHEADRAAKGKEPLVLASALVKVASFNNTAFIPSPSIHGENNGGGLTHRVKLLIEGGRLEYKFPSLKVTSMSFLTTAFLALSLWLPLSAGQIGNPCSKEHCEEHIDKLGNDCKSHCDSSHKHM